MRMMQKWFTEHPASVNETYFQHLAHASWFAGMMVLGAVACFLHALIPGMCVKSGSRIITRLHDRMVINRVAPPSPARQSEMGAQDQVA